MTYQPDSPVNFSTVNNSLWIDTPENVLLDMEIAGFASRCMAAIIDYIIYFIIAFIVLWLGRSLLDSPATSAILVIIYVASLLFYHFLFEFFWNGQTIGKRRLGLRVVGEDGRPLSTVAALIRNILRLVDFLPLFYGVGLLSIFITRKTQRLGDLAAKTIVIRERNTVSLTVTPAQPTRLSYIYKLSQPVTQCPPYIHIEQLTEQDYHLIVQYLQRRTTLVNPMPLAFQIAESMLRKMGDYSLTTNVNNTPVYVLEQIALAFEQHYLSSATEPPSTTTQY